MYHFGRKAFSDCYIFQSIYCCKLLEHLDFLVQVIHNFFCMLMITFRFVLLHYVSRECTVIVCVENLAISINEQTHFLKVSFNKACYFNISCVLSLRRCHFYMSHLIKTNIMMSNFREILFKFVSWNNQNHSLWFQDKL